jgi:hypothetical protein
MSEDTPGSEDKQQLRSSIPSRPHRGRLSLGLWTGWSAAHPEPHHTQGVDEDFFTGEPQVQAGLTCHRRAVTMVIPVWRQELSDQPRADPGSLGGS